MLLHNSLGPFHGLPRTAAWGYPEPYTLDLMIYILGIAVSGNQKLMMSIRKVLVTLAKNQSTHGHIPSLVHNKDDSGASDTKPLFLFGTAIFRKVSNEPDFLQEAVEKAIIWMDYQSPTDRMLVAQQPTGDWRDEQWVIGYGLYVNSLVYCYLRLFNQNNKADQLRKEMTRFTFNSEEQNHTAHEGLLVKHKPYFALWSYKIYSNERFDLLGNCLAILSGIASASRAEALISWIEKFCAELRKNNQLAINLPPNFFPYIMPEDQDWLPRYETYNNPGEYHNGGIWPFICGLYIAALVAAKRYKLAREKLEVLTSCIKLSITSKAKYGFNEWIKAQDGKPKGQDWQTWSAALYLYAAKCLEDKRTPYFEEIRNLLEIK